jgi:tRNA (uracil-5-)-methyltransferase TRM9
MTQRLLEAVSPGHGRILIYVWAIEQDEQSKRIIPVTEKTTCTDTGEGASSGQDVFVPWVLSSENARTKVPRTAQTQNLPDRSDAIRRYYHMFAKDELRGLTQLAAQEIGLLVDSPPSPVNGAKKARVGDGVEIVATGWERSNYYIELRRWKR